MCKKKNGEPIQFFGEFTKVVFVVLLVVGVATIITAFIGIFVGKTVASTVIPTALTLLFGDFLGYCYKSFKEKDSLNKNGLQIAKDGTVSKIVTTAVKAAKSVTGKPSGEDSDETEID